MNEPLRFDGRVALVTGAGHGVGRLYALALAERGACVVVNDIDPEARAEVTSLIQSSGGRAVDDGGDVARFHDAQAMTDVALERFGRIDIVINNAGFVRDRTFHKMSEQELDRVLDVHLRGSAYVTRAAWTHLRAQNYGRVVFTTSSAGLWGNFGQANYAAAKLGVVGLMNTLELEGESHGIRVNTIAPFALTRMSQGIFPEHLHPHMSGDSVAALVSYLCAECCSVSGEVFEVGAGRIRRVRLQASDGFVFGAQCTPETIAREMQRLHSQPSTHAYRSVWDAFESFMSHCDSGSS